MRKPKVELWIGKDGKWYFHKRNANGRVTEPSQGYAYKRSAVKAARRDIPGVPIVLVQNKRFTSLPSLSLDALWRKKQ